MNINIEKFLDEKGILIPSLFYSANLLKINKQIKINQQLLRTLGKGKWLLFFALIENKNITIITYSLEYLAFLINGIFPNKNISFVISSDAITNKNSKIFFKNFENFIEIKTVGKYNELEIKGNLKKNSFLKMLRKILLLTKNYAKVDIFFQSAILINFKAEISDGNTIIITTNRDSSAIINCLNSIMASKNTMAPCYYLIYVNIKTIKGEEWKNLIRHGEIIKEYGSFKNKKVEKFKF